MVGAKVATVCDDAMNIAKCGLPNPKSTKYGDALNAYALLADGSILSVLGNDTGTLYRGPGVLSKTYAIISVYYFFGKRKISLAFYLTDDGIIPQGRPEETLYPFPDFGKQSGLGAGYTAWVLTYKNMDYLHCPKVLSWNGKHSCK